MHHMHLCKLQIIYYYYYLRDIISHTFYVRYSVAQRPTRKKQGGNYVSFSFSLHLVPPLYYGMDILRTFFSSCVLFQYMKSTVLVEIIIEISCYISFMKNCLTNICNYFNDGVLCSVCSTFHRKCKEEVYVTFCSMCLQRNSSVTLAKINAGDFIFWFNCNSKKKNFWNVFYC